MTSRPPQPLEGFVRLLVPAAAREHIIGDLSERYRSPGRYLSDALGVLPFVVGSQVRRTCDVAGLAVLALLIFKILDIMGGAPWPAAALPTVVALAVLLGRNLYQAPAPAPCAPATAAGAAVDVLSLAVVLVLCQAAIALLAPRWLAAPRSLSAALAAICVMCFFFRLLHARSVWPPAATRSLSATELALEARGFRTLWRRSTGVQLAAALPNLAQCVALLWAAPTPVLTTGGALGAAGALWVAGCLWSQARVRSGPSGPDDAGCSLVGYRHILQQRSRQARRVVWWYVLPLLPGPGLLLVGQALQHPDTWPQAAQHGAELALLQTLIVWQSLGVHAQCQRRLHQLAKLSQTS